MGRVGLLSLGGSQAEAQQGLWVDCIALAAVRASPCLSCKITEG